MNKVIVKIMKMLVKVQKYVLEKWIGKDDVEYEDYYYTIQKHEKEIARIEKESKT